MPESHHLGRRAQAHIDDLSVGIVATSPDPDDPVARMNIVDRGSRSGDIRNVRPGDEVHVGRYTLVFQEVVPGSQDGYVTFTVSRTATDHEESEPEV